MFPGKDLYNSCKIIIKSHFLQQTIKIVRVIMFFVNLVVKCVTLSCFTARGFVFIANKAFYVQKFLIQLFVFGSVVRINLNQLVCWTRAAWSFSSDVIFDFVGPKNYHPHNTGHGEKV
jgi:hypothetical protein